MKAAEIAVVIILLLSFGASLYFYDKMPDMVASHWDSQGEVNGYMPKFWGLFLVPIISVIVVFLLILIPRIDPKKTNIDKFKKYFDWFIILFMLFMLYIHILTILWNLAYRFDMVLAMLPAFSMLFYYMGVVIEHAKLNWTIGIRNPWTMSSEKVWDKTHKLGGKLFKACGIIVLLGLVFKEIAIWLIIIPIFISITWSFAYSYHEFKKERKGRK
jgi:uncharacterized membrane protein